MLVKEELLRELILLLLRSLENRNPGAWSQLGPVPPHCSPACSVAVGYKQQHSTASKGAAGLSHRGMAAMPLVPSLFHAWYQVVSSQRLSITASHLCSRAEGGHRGCQGFPPTARPLLRITYHGDSPCPHPQIPAVPPAARAPASGYLHELQILEGRELPWDLSELVSIQIAARENKSTSGRLRSRRSLPLPPLSPVHHHRFQASRSFSSITSLLHPGPKGLSGDSWACRGASV